MYAPPRPGSSATPGSRSAASTPVSVNLSTPQSIHPQNPGQGQGQGHAMPSTNNPKVQPLLCSGHTRPVTHLQFSNM